MEVQLVVHAESQLARNAARLAFERLASLDNILSDWIVHSELRRLERQPHGKFVAVSRELFDVIAQALEFARMTDGAFDPTIGAMTRIWRQQRDSTREPTDAEIEAARAAVDYRMVQLDPDARSVALLSPGIKLDLGGIAKGWILDQLRDTLSAVGIKSMLLIAGGDIVAGEPPPGCLGWNIEVATQGSDSIISVSNVAVATSGPRFQRIRDGDGTWRSHVIDAATGQGLSSERQITVIHRSGAIADALATALTILDHTTGANLALRLSANVILSSPQFRDQR
jgi:thiamine biosynthesis lipoprotein